jgi:hypothetical protein
LIAQKVAITKNGEALGEKQDQQGLRKWDSEVGIVEKGGRERNDAK